MCAGGRDLPLLQDEAGKNVWSSWEAGLRDVIILDMANQKLQVYNLALKPLSEPTASDANYTELKSILIQSIGGP